MTAPVPSRSLYVFTPGPDTVALLLECGGGDTPHNPWRLVVVSYDPHDGRGVVVHEPTRHAGPHRSVTGGRAMVDRACPHCDRHYELSARLRALLDEHGTAPEPRHGGWRVISLDLAGMA